MSQTRLPLLLTCLFLLMIGGSSCNHTKSIAYVNEKYANDASQFMELAGLNVHYRDEGAGKPIIMVHGLGGFLQMWDAWAEDFSQDHRVIRMDLPMSGLTGPLPELPDEASIDLFVDFLHGFILKTRCPGLSFSWQLVRRLGGLGLCRQVSRSSRQAGVD